MSKSESKCPECGGRGVVVLLTSSRPCAAQNKQTILDATPPNMQYTFDSQGRLIQAVCSHPAGAVATYTYDDPKRACASTLQHGDEAALRASGYA